MRIIRDPEFVNHIEGAFESLALNPDMDVYSELKKCILESTTLSKEEKFAKLWQTKSLEGRTPKQHLAYLRSLAGIEYRDAFFIKENMLAVLPAEVGTQVSGLPLDLLASEAERLIKLRKRFYQFNDEINSAVPSRAPVKTQLQNDNIARELADLKNSVNELRNQGNNDRYHRNKAQPPRCNERFNPLSYSNRNNFQQNGRKCYYHARFNNLAQKCEGQGCIMSHVYPPSSEN